VILKTTAEERKKILKPETGSTSTSSRPEEVDLKYGDEGFQELLKVMLTPST
jgi:hypothetical protein